MRKVKINKGGFTFIEAIIVMALFLVLAGAGLGAYFNYYTQSLASMDINNTLTLIKQTRFKALKNPTTSDYGIHLDSVMKTITSFKDIYNLTNQNNIVLKLEQLNITDLNLNPDIGITNEILFKKQTGKTVNTGSFTIENGSIIYTFNINEQGVIN
jgi:prepilin-type N-terminal cleavage/methylation domain-containing protein